MYHSISFYHKSGNSWYKFANTWDDWHLIPASRPVIKPPKVNERLIEVPGRDGLLDITEAVNGTTTFGNREGSWDFYIVLGDYFNTYWGSEQECYDRVMNDVHGKKLRVEFEDMLPGTYYEGRIKVDSWDPDDIGKITISYSLNPYKIITPVPPGGNQF